MKNPKLTKSKLAAIGEHLIEGLFCGILLFGAINFLIGTSLPLLLGAILGAAGGAIYGALPGSSSDNQG